MTTMTTKVDQNTSETLSKLSAGDIDMLAEALEFREEWRQKSGLDPRSYALVKIAALITLDAAPASFVWQVQMARAAGVSDAEITGVLIALVGTIGMARTVAAAPELALALGLEIEVESPEEV